MKKLVTVFIMLATISFSSAFAQSERNASSIHKQRAALLISNKKIGSHSHINKQTAFNFPSAKPFDGSHGSIIAIDDSVITWVWDTLQWDLNNKEINMAYNAHQCLTSYLDQSWSGTAWVDGSIDTNTYDASNNLISDIRQQWNGTSWVNYQLNAYTYDALNNWTSLIYQSWSGTAWANQLLYTRHFDIHNNNTSYIQRNWNGSNWVIVYGDSSTYTYNSSNDIVTQIEQSYDTATSTWVNLMLYSNSFDADNNLINWTGKSWNGSTWVSDTKATDTYNATNDWTGELGFIWNGTAWENSYRDTMIYDAHHNQINCLEQLWKGAAWVKSWRESHTYDVNNLDESDVNIEWDSTGTTIAFGDSIYHYFQVVTGMNNLVAQQESIKCLSKSCNKLYDNRNQ